MTGAYSLVLVAPLTACAVAGFRRWSAYRSATLAGAVTNTVFGLVKASILMATVAAAGGTLAGYDAREAATFAWVSQALLAPVSIFAAAEMAERVRSGDVAVDLARPVDPQLASWASDLGPRGTSAPAGPARSARSR